jgi:hypothetical protein
VKENPFSARAKVVFPVCHQSVRKEQELISARVFKYAEQLYQFISIHAKENK